MTAVVLAGLEPAAGAGEVAGASAVLDAIGLRAMRRVLGPEGRFDGAAPRHEPLLRRWRVALASPPERQPVDPREEDAALEHAYAQLGFRPRMAQFHRAALAVLPALLRDEISLHRLLFGEGDVLEALAAYQSGLVTRALNRALADTVAGLADGRRTPLHVLEVGAGAGLTTDAVLAAVDDRVDGHAVDYRVSDLSAVFTQDALVRYRGRRGLRADLVDLDRDLPAQGVPAGSVDVLVAGHVLHNAVDLPWTLRALRAALGPGGVLLFTESVGEPPAVLTSMSLLLSPAPGRAGAGSGDGRLAADRLFPDLPGWARLLEAAGFAAPALAPEPGSALARSLAPAGQYLFATTVSGR
ncbi:class I SAM-dependent methyltransferase [Amycolatopsis sp. A1MSW2902]|uniref:class I SAM-dependent methyltransferase n=1 Tax=Amycolatopsis sp. A1MSW2902 TaxID=687413 RepID=UPI00307F6DEC